ncbi:MBL fold metallo-hydrolase [Streptomyces rapamycinicus]|uniref:Membrane protein n=2 Tax=Streptomyces rapamycinicus TaxID=1226757 RepID=A0A3L8R440_STRRN|nr:MBL fold metallo-hydrolase [Streptomyces rapamycinicus]MBB4781696.1 L-ascorbate metabolism protein UlaG (beta-lactamase superfamily) [Streptomyces rapamycinicus]RLV73662.1 membrane protein [Streptomyces rapamycinicus NRRL 5491]UTO62273.1 MBL fold metallo-hydrolase [Streptomyces rapamycinicus]UTP30228.1 MBL fold metallo-hydrolase [Streptomyces rapamycinicus NRRL 5491]
MTDHAEQAEPAEPTEPAEPAGRRRARPGAAARPRLAPAAPEPGAPEQAALEPPGAAPGAPAPGAPAPGAPAPGAPAPGAPAPGAPAPGAPAPGAPAPGAPAPGAPRPPGEIRSWPPSFADRLTSPLPGVRALARLAREGRLRPPVETLREIPELPFEPGPLPLTGPGRTALTWAGHASWVVRIGGLTVLTDPVWARKILGTPARVTPVGVRWEDLPPVDAVVISHNHYDHLDAPTVKRLPRATPVLVPAGLARWFRARGFTRVAELDWWEAAELPGEDGPVRFDFVPAHHWSKRTLTDTCRSLWGGWVITAPDGQRVYFAGDTGYGHWFRQIGRRYSGIDVALLPIGAYEPRWMLGGVHTDPEEAVQAQLDLGARILAPMHWSTFLLSAEPPLEPLHRIRAAWEATGRPREELWDLPVGASRVLE